MNHYLGASLSIIGHTSTRLLLVLLLLSVPASLAAAQNPPASGFRLQEATIADIHAAFAAGTLTCRQLVGLYLDRIRAYEDDGPKLNAITTVNPKALEVAATLDAQRQTSGRMESLHCIPVLLKDNINTADMPTTVGSAILKNSVPRDDAPIVTALRNAEALILGKAAMGELAGRSYNTVDGQAVNPYNFKPPPELQAAARPRLLRPISLCLPLAATPLPRCANPPRSTGLSDCGPPPGSSAATESHLGK
jgi:hypothetical protein